MRETYSNVSKKKIRQEVNEMEIKIIKSLTTKSWFLEKIKKTNENLTGLTREK